MSGFDESKHPRDKNGRFAEKGTGNYDVETGEPKSVDNSQKSGYTKLVLDDDDSRAVYERITSGKLYELDELYELPVFKKIEAKIGEYEQKYGVTANNNTSEREQLRRNWVQQFLVGDGADMLILRALDGDESRFAECKAAFKRLYDKDMRNQTRPYDGVNKMLSDITAQGIAVAVLSNKYDSAVKELCAYFFGDKIKYAAGQKDGIKVKPDPTALLKLLDEAGVKAEEAAYCGDGEADVLCAKAAGVDFIAATWGFRHYSVLEKAGAHIFAEKPVEVTGLLNTLE